MALLASGCIWKRSDKIGGPDWRTTAQRIDWRLPAQLLRDGELEFSLTEASLQTDRAAYGIVDCTASFTFRFHNLGTTRVERFRSQPGVELRDRSGRRQPLSTMAEAPGDDGILDPGETETFRMYTRLSGGRCQGLDTLLVGATEVPLQER
jgi:hypothetical protein